MTELDEALALLSKVLDPGLWPAEQVGSMGRVHHAWISPERMATWRSDLADLIDRSRV